MFKKIILVAGIIAVSVLGIMTLSFGGAVPTTHPRSIGNVTDTHAKMNLGQLYQLSYTKLQVVSPLTFTVLIDLSSSTYTRSRTHATMKVKTEGRSYIRVSENPTVTSSGTAIPSYSRNRELADTPQTLFYISSVMTDSGTVIANDITTAYDGSDENIKSEWVFPDGNSYLVEMMDLIGGTIGSDINLIIEFFETD